MVWKNQSLIDSVSNNFGGREDIGPVNKLQPMQGGVKSTPTPSKGLTATQYLEAVKIRKNNPTLFDRFTGFFSQGGREKNLANAGMKQTPTEISGGGSTSYGTYVQYFGIAAVGLAVGDFAGSIYNKRKAKRKK